MLKGINFKIFIIIIYFLFINFGGPRQRPWYCRTLKSHPKVSSLGLGIPSISDPIFCILDMLVPQRHKKQSLCCQNDPDKLQIFIFLSDSALFCKLPKSRKYLFDLDIFNFCLTLKYFRVFCKYKKMQRIILCHIHTSQH